MSQSPKTCLACGKQAPCTNSRQRNGHIIRRYVCGCGARWSTAEIRIEDEGSLPQTRKVEAHLKNMGRANAREIIGEAIERLSALL